MKPGRYMAIIAFVIDNIQLQNSSLTSFFPHTVSEVFFLSPKTHKKGKNPPTKKHGIFTNTKKAHQAIDLSPLLPPSFPPPFPPPLPQTPWQSSTVAAPGEAHDEGSVTAVADTLIASECWECGRESSGWLRIGDLNASESYNPETMLAFTSGNFAFMIVFGVDVHVMFMAFFCYFVHVKCLSFDVW